MTTTPTQGAELVALAEKCAEIDPIEKLPAGHLYRAINNLLCHIGYEGSIDAKHGFVQDAMDALQAIDGGVYLEEFAKADERRAILRAEPAHSDDLIDRWTKINPEAIVHNCSPVHIQNVIADLRRDVLNLAAALRSPGQQAGEPSEWRPIETAPKDGTRILVHLPTGRRTVQEVSWAYDYEGAPGHWSTPFGPVGRGYTILPEAPTHWMPLPKAPARVSIDIREDA